jgi:hypothetical protein
MSIRILRLLGPQVIRSVVQESGCLHLVSYILLDYL